MKEIEKIKDISKIYFFDISSLSSLIEIQKKRLSKYSLYKSKKSIKLKTRKKLPIIQNRKTVRNFRKISMKKDIFFDIIINSFCKRFLNSKITKPYSLPKKTYPAAGGLNMLDFIIYVNNISGIGKGYYLLDPYEKKLIKLDLNLSLKKIFKFTENVNLENSCFTVLFISDLKAGIIKYGPRAYRYCLIEAGHAAQNLLLCSSYFKFSGVCLGAFEQIGEKSKNFKPIEYGVAIGK